MVDFEVPMSTPRRCCSPPLELLLRLLLLAAGPALFFWLDWTARSIRGPSDTRAEECSVMWVVIAGVWALTFSPQHLRTRAYWTLAGVGWLLFVDAWAVADNSALPPPIAMFFMLLLWAVCSAWTRVRGRP